MGQIIQKRQQTRQTKAAVQHKTKSRNPAERLSHMSSGCIEACHADEFNSTRMSAHSGHHISRVDELSPAMHGDF